MMLFAVLWACGGGPEAVPPDAALQTYPPTAKVETYEQLRDDLQAVRHPADGGGRAWLEEGRAVTVGEIGTWIFGFEVGPEGIAEGGRVYFQAPPFWGWSTPQTTSPQRPGFVEISSDVSAKLKAETLDQQLLAVTVMGGALTPGEQIFVAYTGQADRFAEREEAFWFAVDGDGDGIRKNLDPVRVDVAPGPPRRLLATLPTVGSPGEPLRLAIAVMDGRGNAHPAFSGTVRIEGPASLGLPRDIDLSADDRGCGSVSLIPEEAGVFAVQVSHGGLRGQSNPLVVRAGAQPILWGDLQVHTGLSDGTGTPEDAYVYARDVAALDVAVITDHDHWGMRFLDDDPQQWERVKRAAHEAYAPGHFVTAVGYEWTNWVHGHRHVLFFDDRAELFSALDARYDTPPELWSALRGRDALTIAHHSAGGPVAVNWNFPPDPRLEPLTEIVSVHGQSESPSTPGAIYDAVPGNFVIDQLGKGYKLGFIGSTDGHDGHPGLGHLAAPSGGLAAIVGAERTRESVAEALRARRVYATNGVRTLLRFEVDGHPMGSVIAPPTQPVTVMVRAVGTAPVVGMELVRTGNTLVRVEHGDAVAYRTWTLEGLTSGEYVYVRVFQADGGMAWSSPVFIE